MLFFSSLEGSYVVTYEGDAELCLDTRNTDSSSTLKLKRLGLNIVIRTKWWEKRRKGKGWQSRISSGESNFGPIELKLEI